jgi:hypothetical protein
MAKVDFFLWGITLRVTNCMCCEKRELFARRVRQAGPVFGLSQTDAEPDPRGDCPQGFGESGSPSSMLSDESNGPVGFHPIDRLK